MVTDVILTLLALAVLIYALTLGTGMITRAAAAFVVGSAFLRQAATRPIFLKLGGVSLVLGGAFLAAYGFSGIAASETSAVLAILTLMTGLSVVLASLLTYEGGVFACRNMEDTHDISHGLWTSVFHHKTSLLARALETVTDRPVMLLNALARSTVLLPIPAEMRDNRPFETSMWVRLPWRVLTCIAAISTGAWVFAAANAAWSAGDISIGSIDWDQS